MTARIALRTLLTLASGAFLMAATSAEAGLFRAYLSVNGKDTNACTVTAPCRLLPAALNAVDDGGEIWILDSANFNTTGTYIGKSVTIVAVPGALASLLSNNGSNSLNVYVPSGNVTLRNLNFLSIGDGSLGTNQGISLYSTGTTLIVENSEFHGFATGIELQGTDCTTMVKDSVVRNNQTGIDAEASQDVTLDNVRVFANFFGVTLDDGARVRVTNSVIANNSSVALYPQSHYPGALTVLTVTHSTITGSPSTTGLYALATTGTAEAIAISNTFDMGTAFQFGPFGGSSVIYTDGNNSVVTYSSAVSGGTLTPLTLF